MAMKLSRIDKSILTALMANAAEWWFPTERWVSFQSAATDIDVWITKQRADALIKAGYAELMYANRVDRKLVITAKGRAALDSGKEG